MFKYLYGGVSHGVEESTLINPYANAAPAATEFKPPEKDLRRACVSQWPQDIPYAASRSPTSLTATRLW